MAFIFCDGCDNYSADADILYRWDSSVAAELNVSTTGGRYGGGAIQFFDNTADTVKNFPTTGTATSTDEFFASASLYFPVVGSIDYPIFTFRSPQGNTQATLRTDSTGRLFINRGGGAGVELATTAGGVITAGTWLRLEMMIVVSATAGAYEVRVNGTSVIPLTIGANTKNTISNSDGVGGFAISGNDQTTTTNGILWDDIILHNSQGSAFNDFLGDIRIETLRPDAAGDSSDSTATGAATRHEAVDDSPDPDDDTTYVAMTTAADEDLYNIGALAGSPVEIKAVVVNACARRTEDPRQIALKVKHSTTEGTGTTLDVPTTYETLQHAFTTNPSTTAAWTETEVNAAQIGYEVIT